MLEENQFMQLWFFYTRCAVRSSHLGEFARQSMVGSMPWKCFCARHIWPGSKRRGLHFLCADDKNRAILSPGWYFRIFRLNSHCNPLHHWCVCERF